MIWDWKLKDNEIKEFQIVTENTKLLQMILITL